MPAFEAKSKKERPSLVRSLEKRSHISLKLFDVGEMTINSTGPIVIAGIVGVVIWALAPLGLKALVLMLAYR